MTDSLFFRGDDYLDFPELERRCWALAAAHPEWVSVSVVGRSRQGRPMLLVTIGRGGDRDDRTGFWLDGGTHAAEWTGVMSALFTASRWVEGLAAGDADLAAWFSRSSAYVMPCVSPDGFQAMMEGAPFLRSTLRPPPPGVLREGFEPCDMDGDGRVRWMRWRHPAGAWVDAPTDPTEPGSRSIPRPRTLDDDPTEAYFLASEGRFINWDGVRWTAAPREFGLDLNRNFPGSWTRFSMFGMDGGDHPLSEPESRAVVAAFRARRRIAVALTNHTYTGCILTQPYRQDSPLADADVRLMEALATGAVAGTGYRTFRTCPDFMYDPKASIVGVWSDTMTTTFGVPAYTLELWDPVGHVGVTVDKPIEFFMKPEPAMLHRVIGAFAAETDGWRDWKPLDHPQLGAVEVGGLEYLRTVRNPPTALLAAECERGFTVADRLRRSGPLVRATLSVEPLGEGARLVTLVLENVGFLSTSSLAHAESIGAAPAPTATLACGGDALLAEGTPSRSLTHLDGWGTLQITSANLLYANLPDRGHRAWARWTVRGDGPVQVEWDAGRGGNGLLVG
ncbi:MAG: hypothetical protein ACI8PZ_006603 [Myxococcota bacterium]|jgi:hypothetical protein